MEHQCSAKTYENHSFYPCSRKGKIERDGKWYCKQHDPVEVERRAKESELRYQKESNALKESWDRQRAALAAVEGVSTEALNGGIIRDFIEALELIVNLSSGWDDEGSTGPVHPLSWESVGRMAMDYAKHALAKLEAQ